MDIPSEPLIAFFGLPQEVQDWYEKQLVQACWELGKDYDFEENWFAMPRSEQWMTVAMIIEQSAPKSQACPRVVLNKRAGALKVPTLLNTNADCVPVNLNSFTDDSTEKVKKILLNWSKVRFIGNEGSGKTSKAMWL